MEHFQKTLLKNSFFFLFYLFIKDKIALENLFLRNNGLRTFLTIVFKNNSLLENFEHSQYVFFVFKYFLKIIFIYIILFFNHFLYLYKYFFSSKSPYKTLISIYNKHHIVFSIMPFQFILFFISSH